MSPELTAMDLPLLFVSPPGWPRPSVEWLAAHQGWTPPADWVPNDGSPPAPPGWGFWTRNHQVWPQLCRDYAGRATRAIWIGAGITVAGVILTAAGYSASSGVGGPFLVFWGAIVFGPVQMIRGMTAFRQADADLERNVRAASAQVRQEREREAY